MKAFILLLSFLSSISVLAADYAQVEAFFDDIKENRFETAIAKMDQDPSLIQTSSGWRSSPLHYAAELCRIEIANALIARKADLNFKKSGTPLSKAIVYKCLPVAEALLFAGADPNLRASGDLGFSEYRPLGFAIRGRNPEMVKLLIRYKADLKLEKWALEAMPLGGGGTPLENPDEIKVLRVLLEAGVDPNQCGFESKVCPIDAAARLHQLEMSKLLIQFKAKLDVASIHPLYGAGKIIGSALAIAAQSGQLELTRELLKAGANPNYSGGSNPPTFAAISEDSVDTLAELLNFGADPKYRGNLSTGDADISLVHFAAVSGSPKCIEFFAKQGFSLDPVASFERSTPLTMALKFLNGQSTAKFVETIMALISNGANLRARVKSIAGIEVEPIHLIAMKVAKNEKEVLRYISLLNALLKSGVPVDARPEMGQTALHLVGASALMEFLLFHGADPNANDGHARTPLHALVQSCRNDDDALRMIEKLLDAGTEINARTKAGKTALGLATDAQMEKVMALLKARGGIL